VKPVFLLGPTASGKHEAAALVAQRLGAEIISVDSMKVYRGMDIGTAKPDAETRARVPHHLIDICDPSETYNAGRFVVDARAAQAKVEAAGKRALFVGGTSLYYKTYVYGMFDGPSADARLREELAAMGGAALHAELQRVDPASAGRIHPNDLKRLIRAVEVFRLTETPISEMQTHFDSPKIEGVTVCLRREKEDLEKRVADRVRKMVAMGLVTEVKTLHAQPSWGKEGRQAIGYREIVAVVEGRTDLRSAEREIMRNTMQFAKRQLQWFRSFSEAKFVDCDARDAVETIAEKVLEQVRQADVVDHAG
jgi:tRNA dimethylallyltransferase